MEPEVEILFEGEREEYAPGATLTGSVEVQSSAEELKSLELSVLWQTEGKGDTDTGLACFEALAACPGSHPFSVDLPLLPLTYYGHLLKIHWVVRVRVDRHGGQDQVYERLFTLRAPAGSPASVA